MNHHQSFLDNFGAVAEGGSTFPTTFEELQQLQQHPLSAAFPAMGALELIELSNDIRRNGLRNPIVVFEGMVLDGWHRLKACIRAERLPRFEEFHEDQDPRAFVWSLNGNRRHMDAGQKAVAETLVRAWAPTGRPEKVAAVATLQESRALSNQEMAQEAGVSPRTIRQAKEVVRAGLSDAVRDGKVSLERAAEVAKLPEPERQAALEAPRAPRPKPAPKPPSPPATGWDARIAELEAQVKARDEEIAALKEQNEELARLMKDTMEENASINRILDAEDLKTAFQGEVKRYMELARVTQARNTALTVEVNDLKGLVKRWRGKFERLEKTTKASLGLDPEPELPPMPEEEDLGATA